MKAKYKFGKITFFISQKVFDLYHARFVSVAPLDPEEAADNPLAFFSHALANPRLTATGLSFMADKVVYHTSKGLILVKDRRLDSHNCPRKLSSKEFIRLVGDWDGVIKSRDGMINVNETVP